MKFCSDHWAGLRKAIQDKGLWAFVAAAGEELVKKVEANGFEPLLGAHNAICCAALRDGGLRLLAPTEDGSHLCPLCEAGKQDASLPQDWIDGAAEDQRLEARRRGLIAPQ